MSYLTDEDFQTAKANGLSSDIVYQRYYIRNWSRERAVTVPKMAGKGEGLWTKYKEIAVVGCDTFYKRIRQGLDPQSAATLPRGSLQNHPITEEQYKIAEANDISRSTVYVRFHQYKWEIEKAITHPVDVRKRRKTK